MQTPTSISNTTTLMVTYVHKHTYFESNGVSCGIGGGEDFTKCPLSDFNTLFHTMRENTLLPGHRLLLATLSIHFLCIGQICIITPNL